MANEVSESRLKGGSSGALMVAGLGAVALAILFLLGRNTTQFYFSYLVVFMYFLTLSLGSLFLVIIHHLVRSGWSTVLRRISETLATNIWFFPILFLPILAGAHHLYHWTHTHAVMTDLVLKAKSPYLNMPFFLIRAGVYFLVWGLLSRRFFLNSVKQDETGEEKLSIRSQRMSTYGVLLFALSLTFASIDWVMSLTPHWYSTMWGVYTFAGSVVGAISLVSLISLILRKKGYLTHVISVEHFHDLGKLLYGFNVFWSYIAFSQYFLIWYANIPEETIWFAQHFNGSWNLVGIFLAVGHFALPFFMFMSRHAKRNLSFHAFVVCWMLFIHFVDVYWVIMPNARPAGFGIGFLELALFLSFACIYFGLFVFRLSKNNLYPLRDPRIKDSLHHHV